MTRWRLDVSVGPLRGFGVSFAVHTGIDRDTLNEHGQPAATGRKTVNVATHPIAAERLLRWVLPLKLQDPLLGDLAEMYADTCAKFGPAEARRLYWWHAIRSMWPVVMRWSVVAAIAGWLRRFGS